MIVGVVVQYASLFLSAAIWFFFIHFKNNLDTWGKKKTKYVDHLFELINPNLKFGAD